MTPRTKQRTWIALVFLVGVAAGAAFTIWLLAPSFPSQWLTLANASTSENLPSLNSVDTKARFSVSYSNAAFVESDIPVLEVSALSGRGKFLSRSSQSGVSSSLGYIITVSAGALDKSKLPEKYKKEKIITTNGQTLTLEPLDQATYEVYFVFRFLDRDGFELFSINSPKHDIQSGKTTLLQSQTEPRITSRIASLTDKITLHMDVEKCLSATSE